ncbi:hypothetical protein CAPTEDRAFT_44414, partial [Capitella teleta]
GREKCKKCNKSRRYYCYTCFLPVDSVAANFPKVKLPLSVDIIKHPNEIDGKSTAAHAAVIAPDDVTVYSFPDIPHYDQPHRVVLVYPSRTSSNMEEFLDDAKVVGVETESSSSLDEQVPLGQKRKADSPTENANSKRSRADLCPFDKVVFIDSTWAQVTKIASDVRLKDIRRIEMKSQTTKFWRPQQGKPDTYLATIEAIYYFFREFHLTFINPEYDGCYDNLLFLFNFMYHKIKELSNGGKE